MCFRPVEVEIKITCAKCGEKNPPEATKCEFCGATGEDFIPKSPGIPAAPKAPAPPGVAGAPKAPAPPGAPAAPPKAPPLHQCLLRPRLDRTVVKAGQSIG